MKLNVVTVSVALASSFAIACSAPAPENAVDNSGGSIVGGREADPGAWPSTVALYMGSEQGCGGTLIAPEWVLTAGHCVEPSVAGGGLSQAVIGRHQLSSSQGEAHDIDYVIRHEDFTWDMANDIALVHLNTPSSAPVARVVASSDLASVVPGAKVTVVGWGNVDETGPSSDVLREVTVPIIANDACARSYEGMGKILDSMICAGVTEGGLDSCQGDSGGPLYETINGKNVLVGIVSWGEGCARPDRPGVYTRLSSHLAWVAKMTTAARTR